MKPISILNTIKYQFKFFLALIIVTGTTNSVQAQSVKPVPPNINKIQFVPPTPPSRGMPSGRQKGAASRGGCPTTDKSLTALVPASAIASKPEKSLTTRFSVGGLTTAKRPSFYFYVPYTRRNLPIEFVLQDNRGKNVYKSSLNISHHRAGVIQIDIPKAASLQLGKVYQWFFLVSCIPEAPPFVRGWVQRVSPSIALTSQLKSASPKQQIALYAQNGFWYDALTALAQLRLSNPNDPDLIRGWEELLNAAGTGEIVNEPMNKCCTLAHQRNRVSKPISQQNVRSPKKW